MPPRDTAERRPEALADGRRPATTDDRPRQQPMEDGARDPQKRRRHDPVHTNWRNRGESDPDPVEERRDTVPALSEGTEVIGEYADSGYREPPHIARRGDGTVVQLTPLVSTVARHLDGRSTYDTVADRVSGDADRSLSADDVAYLVEEKLRPLGLVTMEDGSQPELRQRNPLLALTARASVIPVRVTRRLAAMFSPLFFGPVVVAVIAALVAFDVWLFAIEGVGQGIRQTLQSPGLIVASLGILVVSAAFHEIGHAAACRYSGAEPGVMGAGIYLIWPVFYTDVTDAYRLDKRGRLRTDLGGVYFNAIVILAMAGIYALTGQQWVLAIVLIQHLEIGRQLLPFVRLDGYYVVADLTGVPDLFARMKPILRSLLPWNEKSEEVRELKPWVRWAVTGWVMLVVPFLAFNLGIIVLNFPRIAATTLSAAREQIATMGEGGLQILAGAVQFIAVLLPLAGLSMMIWKLGQRAAVAGWQRTAGRPAYRFAYSIGGLAVLAAVGWSWLPNGDWLPIQEGERWTVQETITSYRDLRTGDPGMHSYRAADARGDLVPDEGRESPSDEFVPAPGAQPQPGSSPLPAPDQGSSGSSGGSQGSSGSSGQGSSGPTGSTGGSTSGSSGSSAPADGSQNTTPDAGSMPSPSSSPSPASESSSSTPTP